MAEVNWDIRREGRRWRPGEMRERWEGLPEKFEVIDGQLPWSEAEKLHLLGVLLGPSASTGRCGWAIRRCGARRLPRSMSRPDRPLRSGCEIAPGASIHRPEGAYIAARSAPC
jgi:hypothetical protein